MINLMIILTMIMRAPIFAGTPALFSNLRIPIRHIWIDMHVKLNTSSLDMHVHCYHLVTMIRLMIILTMIMSAPIYLEAAASLSLIEITQLETHHLWYACLYVTSFYNKTCMTFLISCDHIIFDNLHDPASLLPGWHIKPISSIIIAKPSPSPTQPKRVVIDISTAQPFTYSSPSHTLRNLSNFT